ncbi:MAG: M14 metallopeptidase family protein [Cyclobacteriaceae bacterium]
MKYLVVLFLLPFALFAQIPKPSEIFGFEPGADYKLANYAQLQEYYQKLDEASDRVTLTEIGKTTLGKPMLLLMISSEENISNLDKYRKISRDMALAKIDESTARQNSKDGKAVIWIDGGLHATERAPAQMLPELAYKVVTEESDEMKKIRDNVILLLMPVMNPDGLEIVVDWYKKNLGTPYETTGPPILYHHYVGHDNNRDWFMNNMPESYHVNEMLYNTWYPQIVYNHHQSSPAWARIFLPPFSDPVNPNIHPGTTTGTNLIGTAMANRFAIKKMPGVISHLTFSMWWNGGMRTVPYFHNMVGILTETGHTTPTPRLYPPDSLPKEIGRGRGKVPSNGTKIFYPYPWKGGESHFRDAIDYTLTASMGVLDFAADRKEEYLFNIYSMGRDAIEANILEDFHAYVIPKEQHDFNEATNLVNILRQGGIEVHQASSDFKAGGKTYGSGSYIAYGAQAFRPYLVDMMESQNYPDKRAYPGGPPVPPYDLAGWTLPMQMGLNVDKIVEKFTAKTTEVVDRASLRKGDVSKGNFGYSLSAKNNHSYKAVNQLLSAGTKVHRLSAGLAAGDFVIEGTPEEVNTLAEMLGVDFAGLKNDPGNKVEIAKPKVGLYKSWVANMDEGWTRWFLTEYNFEWDTLHDNDIRERDLSQYTAIIIPDQNPARILNGHASGTMPEEYTGGMGLAGMFKLQAYAKAGGTLIAFDKASDLFIEQFGLPISNVTKGLDDQKFFIPGSLIRTSVKVEHPLAYGMQSEVAASFNRSRAFKTVVKSNKGEGGTEYTVQKAPQPDVDVVASYAKDDLLMSGWALNEKKYIGGKAAMVRVGHGEGNVILFEFRPQFRGQPRATYKLVFNSIYSGSIRK